MPPVVSPRRDANVGQLRVSWLLLVVVALVAVGVVTLAPTLGLFLEQRRDIAALEAQVAEQQANVDALGDEVARWDDPAYIEAQARDRLFYTMPGETSFVLLDQRDPADSREAEVPSAQIAAPTDDWARAAVSSLFDAGLTAAPPSTLAPGSVDPQ